MRVNVVSEVRLNRARDGRIVSVNETRAYPFWKRYLSGFDEVAVVARVADQPVSGGYPVEGPGVIVQPIPDYRGAWQYVQTLHRVHRALRTRKVAGADRWILRLPGQLGVVAANAARNANTPYAVELVGDPVDVFAKGVTDHPLRPVLRAWFGGTTRKLVRDAVGVAYVTERTLQQRYPARPEAYLATFSSVELPDDAFVDAGRSYRASGVRSLISVGRFEQKYKGADVLIDALKLCRASGFDATAEWIGGGYYLAETKAAAERAGLGDRITFHGEVSSSERIRSMLDGADIFVMPSLTEGLPRALLEAMARGLPCVASVVGGIPELLSREFLVPPGDAKALADRLTAIGSDARSMTHASERNLMKAREYRAELLAARRAAFYRELAEHPGHAKKVGAAD